jgi:hypothetical protein
MHKLSQEKKYKFLEFLLLLTVLQLIRSSLIFTKHSFFNTNKDNNSLVNLYTTYIVLAVTTKLYSSVKNKKTVTLQVNNILIFAICCLITFNYINYYYIKKGIVQTTTITVCFTVFTLNFSVIKKLLQHVSILLMLVVYNLYTSHHLNTAVYSVNTVNYTNSVYTNQKILPQYTEFSHKNRLNYKVYEKKISKLKVTKPTKSFVSLNALING